MNRVTDEKEDFSASPAASDGELYIRSDKHLYCVAAMGHEVPQNLVASSAMGSDVGASADAPHGEGSERGEGSGRQGRRRRGGSGFDPSAMFERRDANKDGKLSGDELSERMRGRMEELDTNKDDAITLKEFQSGMRRMSAGRGRGGRERNPREGKPDRPQRPEMEP
ncbi:MAG: hypothetical protein IIB60_05360 [Planctomycetes bacterium]|nr:hypothetical protein [Planctomycetota bacterium]